MPIPLPWLDPTAPDFPWDPRLKYKYNDRVTLVVTEDMKQEIADQGLDPEFKEHGTVIGGEVLEWGHSYIVQVDKPWELHDRDGLREVTPDQMVPENA